MAELVSYIRANYDVAFVSVLADIPGTDFAHKPPFIGGFVPDLYVAPPYLTIGEAKTLSDLQTVHSQNQISAFINHLSHQKSGSFLLAVPPLAINYAKAVLNRALGKLERLPPGTGIVSFGSVNLLTPQARYNA